MKHVSSMVWFKKAKKTLRKNAKDIAVGVVSGLVIANVFFLHTAHADVDTGPKFLDDATVALIVESMQNETRPYGKLPKAEDASPRRTFTIPITAYSSDPWQTDDTPCIAARGFDLCEHDEEDVVAANFLPMGTKLRIPELYGDRVFTVVDRMNERYWYRMDLWKREKSDAKAFGIKYATIEVF
jgi:3D (Asp-Asp-Asp) domain-containing protein